MNENKKGPSSDPSPHYSGQSMSTSSVHIYQLSDEILLMILRYLPVKDLINVYGSCNRLRKLCYEKELWVNIEDPEDNYESMHLVFNKFLSRRTRSLRIASNCYPKNRAFKSSVSPSMLCEGLVSRLGDPPELLTRLSILKQKIDGKLFDLKMLPKCLKYLNLSGTMITGITEESQYFKELSLHLSQLEEFDLTNCSWITGHSLMSLSKFPLLSRLCLQGCRNIGNCFTYIALASRFGFKSLKILDVTNTNVGSAEFTALGGIETLEEFYFGQYDYIVDQDHILIDDVSMITIRNSTNLRILDMTGSSVTNVTLETLGTIPSLTKVYAHFTRLTDEAIQTFHNSHPNCRVTKVDSVQPLPPIEEPAVNHRNIRTVRFLHNFL